jgi:hypothetical protein
MTEGNLEAHKYALASWIGNIYHIFIKGTFPVVSPVLGSRGTLLYSICFMNHDLFIIQAINKLTKETRRKFW